MGPTLVGDLSCKKRGTKLLVLAICVLDCQIGTILATVIVRMLLVRQILGASSSCAGPFIIFKVDGDLRWSLFYLCWKIGKIGVYFVC